MPFKEELSTWDECKNTNVYGLIRLLKNLDVKVGKVVLASSCSLYGPENKRNREPDFLYPNTGYALTKFAQEKILQIYCIEKKINFLCYRIDTFLVLV